METELHILLKLPWLWCTIEIFGIYKIVEWAIYGDQSGQKAGRYFAESVGRIKDI